MLSLSPRRNHRTHKPVLPDGVAFACIIKARLPDLWISRLLLRSLSLRPGCLLTALATALSTGSRRSIALPPAVQATRLWALVMVGLLSYWMYQPCLDARDAPPRKIRNGVHDLVSELHRVWRWGVRYSPFGAGGWLVSRPIEAASGSPAVASGPWN